MVRLFFITTILSLSMQSSFARKPAVEPILGISIEEYKEVDPKKAKGFDFNRKPTSNNTSAVNRTHSQKDLATGSISDSSSSGTLVLLFLIFLPIIACGIGFYKMRKPPQVAHRGLKLLKGGHKDDANNDDEISKAS